jgi:hypothetical protein
LLYCSLSSRSRTRDAPAVSALAADLLADRLPALRFAGLPVFFLAGEAFFFFAVGLGPATADLARADFFATMWELVFDTVIVSPDVSDDG